MNICGLQKTTLVDYPKKVACTIFLHGCNFRCGYCYNADLVIHKPQGIFSENEIFSFLDSRKGIIDAVCITGGEPLLSLEKSFVKKIKESGFDVKIDTNGSNPQRLQEFIDEGLVDYVAMDIKATKEDYEKVTNKNVNLNNLEQTMQIITKLPNYEFRTTILSCFHNKEKIQQIGEWVKTVTNTKPKKYCMQGFKNEGMFLDARFKHKQQTTEQFLKDLKMVANNYFEEVDIRI